MKYTIAILSKIFRFCFKYILGLIFIFLFSSFITVGVNWLNKLVINQLVLDLPSNKISLLFYILLSSYLIIWILSNFIGYLEAFANNLFRLKVDIFIQELLMVKVVKMKQEKFYDSLFLDKYNFVCQNTNNASAFIFKIITILFSNFTIIITSLLIFLKYEPVLIIYAILILIIQAVNTMATANMSYKLAQKQNRLSRISNYLYLLFTNKPTAKEMRIFHFENSILKKWKVCNSKYIQEQNKTYIKQSNFNIIASLLNLIMRFIIIIILLYSVKQGKYDIGTFIMLFGLAESCAGKTQELAGNVFSGLFNEMRYFKDFYDIVFPIANHEIIESMKMNTDSGTELCVGSFEKIELKNVSFSYPNADRKAIDDVSFCIHKGEIISILGYNGSGKTTLSKILYGAFTPCAGEVLLNGHRIENYNLAKIFEYIGVLPQEYAKFSVSIRDTVGLGRIEEMNNEEELKEAYHKVQLEKIINQYENRDLSIIGKEYDENGIDLSGGEMQKIILASAYMGSPEILILDEPTASIDPLKEAELINEFRKNLCGKTAVLISHRIGFARLADRIFMMKDGKIVEKGTHSELLANQGYYAEIYNKQRDLYE